MAFIKPFRAWRYNELLSENLEELTAPLSETMLQQRKRMFYKQPFHFFHISSPSDVPPFQNAYRRIKNWKLDKVIRQDILPAFYVYYQSSPAHTPHPFCRKGFIATIQAEAYDQKIILPHENTIQKAVEYRTLLLENTQMHTIPTHGFYTDKSCQLEKYWDECMEVPICEVKDQNSVLHRLSAIQDQAVIQKFKEVLESKTIWIADGHHRYESSVLYRQKMRLANPQHQGDEDYNFHLMWLTNTESSDLGVLPTHRIVHSLRDFSEEDFLQQLALYFDIQLVEKNEQLGNAPSENLWTFMLIFKNHQYLIQLKKEVFPLFDWDLPMEVKELDVSVMHYFILQKGLGLQAQMQFDYLEFSQYVGKCYEKVEEEKANFAILTRKVTLQEIERVCLSGFKMPAKATYFYPKILGGLLFADAT